VTGALQDGEHAAVINHRSIPPYYALNSPTARGDQRSYTRVQPRLQAVILAAPSLRVRCAPCYAKLRHVSGTAARTTSQPPRRGSVCSTHTTQALPPRQFSLTDLPNLRSSPHQEAHDVATWLSWPARAGWLLEQPPFWGSVATALAVKGGTSGRHAALRGSVCYLVAAFIANIVIKPIVYRRRPQRAGEGRITPVTSSFPSGHTASDSAFVFGVAQELPLLAIPLAAAATAAHWSLIRSKKHYADLPIMPTKPREDVVFTVQCGGRGWPGRHNPGLSEARRSRADRDLGRW
jgi:hypothetical protein